MRRRLGCRGDGAGRGGDDHTMHERVARACAVCNCGDPTLTAVGVEQPYRNRVRAGIEERYGSHSQGDGLDGEASRARALGAVRGVVAASARHRRAGGAVDDDLADHRRRARATLINGLGDMELSGRVLIARDKSFGAHHLLWATAGLKTADGAAAARRRRLSLRRRRSAGLGLVGSVRRRDLRVVFGRAVVGVRERRAIATRAEGWHGYRRGHAGRAGTRRCRRSRGAGARSRWFVEGNWLAQDRLPSGAGMPNTGGTVVRLGPAFVVSPRDRSDGAGGGDGAGGASVHRTSNTMDRRSWCRWSGTFDRSEHEDLVIARGPRRRRMQRTATPGASPTSTPAAAPTKRGAPSRTPSRRRRWTTRPRRW